MMTEKMFERLQKEQLEREMQERQFRHDWKIAIFSAVAGGFAGLITSVVFWLITQ